MAKEKKIALIGRGVVGQTFIDVREEKAQQTKIPTIACFSLSLNAPQTSKTPMGHLFDVFPLESDTVLLSYDVVVFAISSQDSKKLLKSLQQRNYEGLIIDLSSAHRMVNEVPLIIPPLNGSPSLKARPLIAIPNCSAIIALMTLYPLHKRWPLAAVQITTFQAVSGAGQQGFNELEEQLKQHTSNKSLDAKIFPEPILFNVISHESMIGESLFNGEEEKIREECRKILKAPNLEISAACFRVPVFRSHVLSIRFSFGENAPKSGEELRACLSQAKNLKVLEKTSPSAQSAQNHDDVLVGRIRKDPDKDNTWWCISAGDQLRRGAATNAVEILQIPDC